MRSVLTTRRRPAVAVVEVFTATTIMAVVAALAIDAFTHYYRTRDQYLWRLSGAWAAAGQLQRVQAGAPVDSPAPPDLWPPQIHLNTTASPGEGAWRGFQRVTVTATVDLPRNRFIREQISGYVRAEGAP